MRRRPGLIPAAEHEGLRIAPFSYGLPGPLTRPLRIGRCLVAAGTMVLPVIVAAHQDPAHSPGGYDLRWVTRRWG